MILKSNDSHTRFGIPTCVAVSQVYSSGKQQTLFVWRILFSFSLMVVATLLSYSDAISQPGLNVNRKHVTAQSVANGAVHLDGILSESLWKKADFVTDFTEKEPDEGGAPTDKMQVAVVYDDGALYVGAEMTIQDGRELQLFLDRRDTQGPTEQLIVSLDTYFDHRTAYVFGVNAAGVRFERFHGSDSEGDRDYSFNPVWEAKTKVTPTGWSAEMRIPFSQLRFSSKSKQIWGINFNRWIPALNEDVFWVYVPRQETGYSSWFGELDGIENIQPSRRIELLPYAASDGSFTGLTDHFNDGSQISSRLGGTLKMGLGPNLTLEATANPDFGQVEADPAEVNLSAFETFFPERRDFFTEGSQLFDAEGARYFYSRRIGAPPHGSADGEFTDRPDNTTILGATKLTGRLQSGLSVGALAAVTGREYAQGFTPASGLAASQNFNTEVEPATFFGVTRLQQEFGKDASTAGIILTTVQRDIGADSPLRSVLRTQAYSGAADWKLRFAGGKYSITGDVGFSHIRGDTSVIRQAQESSARYYQRPDAGYVSVDPTKTALSGYRFGLTGRKRSGKHWLYGSGFNVESKGFELNDAGILNSADDVGAWNWIGYRETNPGKIFRSYSVFFNVNQSWNTNYQRQFSSVNINGNVSWNNFWRSWFGFERSFRFKSDSRTRGGPLMGFESGWNMWWGFSNSFASETRYGLDGNYSIDELGGFSYRVSGNLSTRIGPSLELRISPSYRREDQPRQYVTTLTGVETTGGGVLDHTAAGAATFGTQYIFSRIARDQLSMQIRANYFFTPDLSLELYAEPFVANGRYYQHGQLRAPGAVELETVAADGSTITSNDDGTFTITSADGTVSTVNYASQNFSFLSFRSNLVLRWEFIPGSTLFAVWQRNLSDSGNNPGQRIRPGELFDTFGGDGSDFFALKISYWISAS